MHGPARTIFTYAMGKGLRIDNPAHGIVKFAEGHRERVRMSATMLERGVCNRSGDDGALAISYLDQIGWCSHDLTRIAIKRQR
jgi:hypothetical protein